MQLTLGRRVPDVGRLAMRIGPVWRMVLLTSCVLPRGRGRCRERISSPRHTQSGPSSARGRARSSPLSISIGGYVLALISSPPKFLLPPISAQGSPLALFPSQIYVHFFKNCKNADLFSEWHFILLCFEYSKKMDLNVVSSVPAVRYFFSSPPLKLWVVTVV